MGFQRRMFEVTVALKLVVAHDEVLEGSWCEVWFGKSAELGRGGQLETNVREKARDGDDVRANVEGFARRTRLKQTQPRTRATRRTGHHPRHPWFDIAGGPPVGKYSSDEPCFLSASRVPQCTARLLHPARFNQGSARKSQARSLFERFHHSRDRSSRIQDVNITSGCIWIRKNY